MQPVSSIPSHILLNRKDDEHSHTTTPVKRGPASAFATYAFGPIDANDTTPLGDKTSSKKAITGISSVSAATGGGLGWLTQLSVSANQTS